MEAITKVKLNATLKGSEVWETGVYDAPVPSELLDEVRAKTRTREGLPMVEVLETKVSKVAPFRTPDAPTSISSVTSSNLREGPMYKAEKKVEVPKKTRKEPTPEKPKLVLRG